MAKTLVEPIQDDRIVMPVAEAKPVIDQALSIYKDGMDLAGIPALFFQEWYWRGRKFIRKNNFQQIAEWVANNAPATVKPAPARAEKVASRAEKVASGKPSRVVEVPAPAEQKLSRQQELSAEADVGLYEDGYKAGHAVGFRSGYSEAITIVLTATKEATEKLANKEMEILLNAASDIATRLATEDSPDPFLET